MNISPAKVLWTGGWDSTFRLIDLVVIHQRVVQPFYIIDTLRQSFPMEIRAMKQLKQSIFAAFPYTKSLILPTRFVELSDIRPNREITESFSRLVELFPQFPLGSQY